MIEPSVSVILPVRNGGALLQLAVESILSQQGVSFDLLVIDDGSSDGTPAYLAAIVDPRLRVLRRESGDLVAALNAGIAATVGPYVARMDADDIALPGRLARQASLLDSEPETAITFSAARIINEHGDTAGMIEAPALSRADRRAVLLDERDGPPIVHPSVMIRRSALEALGGYRPVPVAEDHDLWLRAIDRVGFRAISEPLLLYRHHGGGVSRARAVEQGVSTLLNMVSYRLARDRGIDLFVDRPEVYAALRSWIADSFTPLLTRIAEARRIRSDIKRGHRGAALIAAARFAIRGPGLLTRHGIHRALLLCQRQAEHHGVALLDGPRA